MNENMENLVVDLLRLIRNEIVVFHDEVREHFTRLAIIEQRLSDIDARLADADTAQQKRVDQQPD